MSNGKRLAGLLLISTSLAFPAAAWAQDTDGTADEQVQDGPAPEDGLPQDAEAEQPEVSIPGGGIIVTGRRNRNPERSSTHVLNVLSSEAPPRPGEGALPRSEDRRGGTE